MIALAFKRKRTRRNKKNKKKNRGDQLNKGLETGVNKNKLAAHIADMEDKKRRKKNGELSSDDSLDFL